MPTVGIVCEGTLGGVDEAVLTTLIQRTLTTSHQIIVRPCDGVSNLMKKFPGHLQDFKYRGDIVKAIVVRDGDSKCPAILRQTMQGKIQGRQYSFELCLLVVPQELEAWLLADASAISGLTGRSQAPISNPETIPDPKERLQKLLLHGNIVYTAEQARKLTQAIDPQLLAQQCPSFSRLRRFLAAA